MLINRNLEEKNKIKSVLSSESWGSRGFWKTVKNFPPQNRSVLWRFATDWEDEEPQCVGWNGRGWSCWEEDMCIRLCKCVCVCVPKVWGIDLGRGPGGSMCGQCGTAASLGGVGAEWAWQAAQPFYPAGWTHVRPISPRLELPPAH